MYKMALSKSQGDNPLEDELPEITSDVEKNINKEITKETNKLLYYTEQTDELIESGDEGDLKQVELRCNKIIDRLSELFQKWRSLKLTKGKLVELSDSGKRN